MSDYWECEFCSQNIELDNRKPKRPQAHYANCLLRDHFVGDECLAFRDPKQGMQLLRGDLCRNGRSIQHQSQKPLDVLVKDVMGKRLPDRQAYTIMVGERVYNIDKIERLAELLGP